MDALKYAYSGYELARIYNNFGFYYYEENNIELSIACYKHSLKYENDPFVIQRLNNLEEKYAITFDEDGYKKLMKSKHIKLENDLIDDDIYINGDYQRLSQVIINIIKNSIEAMDYKNNGLIKIRNSIKGNTLNIIIEDNGSGISKKNLKKIKEPFYTTKNRGTGLGVSLSDEIIKAHNGSIDYSSKVGKGTKVVVKLPIVVL